MVSPRTSARKSASSTSLSFSGRMIATISFMRGLLAASSVDGRAPAHAAASASGRTRIAPSPLAYASSPCWLTSRPSAFVARRRRGAAAPGRSASAATKVVDAAVDDGAPGRRPPGCRAAPGCRTSRPSVPRRSRPCSAKTPVSSAPTVPPTPCAATTSSESSSRVRVRAQDREVAREAPRGRRAASADIGLTKPAAGVIATRPTTIAGGRADRGRLAGPDEVEQRPDDERRHRGEHRVGEGQARRARWRQRAAGVEAEPAEPEQAGAEQRRTARCAAASPAGRSPCAARARCAATSAAAAGVDVHDGAAGEVERAQRRRASRRPRPSARPARRRRAPRA